MLRVCVTVLASLVFTGVIGYLLLPVLRALKAGQSIREIGPTWHNNKAGTPMMGGLMFIISAVLCLVLSLPFMEEKTAFYVLILGLCFGLVGFLDDFFKLKFKRNLGLTALQKAMLQMAVSALYLYLLYLEGSMTSDLYIPFLNKAVHIHPMAYIFFAMFVIVGCVNAVNLTDGIDGLCGSVTVPVMVFFTVAAVAMKKWDLALLPAAMVGGLIAYLFYNWHPAKVFMGDTGSLFLGGIVCGCLLGSCLLCCVLRSLLGCLSGRIIRGAAFCGNLVLGTYYIIIFVDGHSCSCRNTFNSYSATISDFDLSIRCSCLSIEFIGSNSFGCRQSCWCSRCTCFLDNR